LDHLLSYAESQFGKQVIEKDYRERKDGERITNWNVDVNVLHNISCILVQIHAENNTLKNTICDDLIFSNLERSLSLLNPYLERSPSLQLDVNASRQMSDHNEN
jgi:hypothetical protein